MKLRVKCLDDSWKFKRDDGTVAHLYYNINYFCVLSHVNVNNIFVMHISLHNGAFPFMKIFLNLLFYFMLHECECLSNDQSN